jgi:hypothetical protein
MQTTLKGKQDKKSRKWLKKLKRDQEFQAELKEIRLEQRNRLERGKWYKFVGLSNMANIYAKPDMYSRVIEHVTRGELVMFVEAYPIPVIPGNGSGTFTRLKVGFKDVFGWIACCHSEGFQVHKHLRKVNDF